MKNELIIIASALVLFGCRGSEPAAREAPKPDPPAPAPTAKSDDGTKAAASDATEAAAPAAIEQTPAAPAPAPPAAPAPEVQAAAEPKHDAEEIDPYAIKAPVGVTPAEASTVCEDIDEDSTTSACAFVPGGKTLPGAGRIDILEMTVEDMEMGEVTRAYAVLRVPGEFIETAELGEQFDIPGQSSVYRLEPIEHAGDVLTLRSTETLTTYPNTGEPDRPSGEYDEVTKIVVRCTISEGACSRE